MIRSFEQMHGGEIFVPKIPSMKLLDMAQAVAPDCQIECIGIGQAKNCTKFCSPRTKLATQLESDDMFVIQPAQSWWRKENWKQDVVVARRVPLCQ